MKIAIAARDGWTRVSGHAGQTRTWLVYDCEPGQPLPMGRRLELSRDQMPHHFRDDGPHPLHGVEIMITASAGEGFVRHMARWGAEVLMTGEPDPDTALRKALEGDALAPEQFDITTTLCRLRDLFSRH